LTTYVRRRRRLCHCLQPLRNSLVAPAFSRVFATLPRRRTRVSRSALRDASPPRVAVIVGFHVLYDGRIDERKDTAIYKDTAIGSTNTVVVTSNAL
jgi:hypothetical protein